MRLTTWNILYRGALSSCNYACDYCPFAKTANTREELNADATALNRFIDWLSRQSQRRIGLLFTPWGEALIHPYYREALVSASWFPHVYRVAIQTNLSGRIDDLAHANHDTLALWATYHPSQTSLERFIAQCQQLDAMNIRYSVGVVGLREHIADIESMREQLPATRYLWINAFKQGNNYYDDELLQRINTVDPYFGLNNRSYASQAKPCRAGDTCFTVDAEGTARRCHFIQQVIGNIYEPDFAARLAPSPCTAATCKSYIGYIHRPELKLDELYGDGILERIPKDWPLRDYYFTT